jgi:ABC-2 family transporter protein
VTALTVPARAEQDANLRPLPWRRMAWVTWRQHRVALTGAAALLGALAVYLWHAGLRVHHAYAAATGCRPAGSIACANLISDFTSTYDHTATLVPSMLQAVPALIGAFVGAPVLARELETGTFRYAWTQGFGRWRWTLAKLVPLAVVVAAAAGALSVLFSWYYRPFIADGQNGPLGAIVFDLRGIAFAAWTLAAFAIGALAGMLIRRVVPAIVATLAAYVGLALAAGMLLREHYLTPLVTSNPKVPGSALIMSQWWTKSGTFAFGGRPPIELVQQLCPPSAVGPGKPSSGAIAQCLSRQGYTLWTRYQPASRFWPFQWIEGAWLLALSLLLIAATVWVVRRRAA